MPKEHVQKMESSLYRSYVQARLNSSYIIMYEIVSRDC